MLNEHEQRERNEFIAGLLGLVNWMEAHPNMPAPMSMNTANIYAGTKERLNQLRRDCGLTNKLLEGGDYPYAGYKREFSPSVKLHLFIKREKVCRRVKVGEKVVPAVPEYVLPAKEAATEPVYEWRCNEPLLSESDTAIEDDRIA